MPDSYESEVLLRQYLDFHYRSRESDYLPFHPLPEGVLGYPERCAAKLIEHCQRFDRALDLGCAVGGSSFALAGVFNEVCGIDFSETFIHAARTLAETGEFRVSETAYRPSSGLRKCAPEFRVGDACALPEDPGIFDAVLMANLLCRLPDPAACLKQLRKITRNGSVLFFSTPCSWDETYTPREKWLTPTLEGLQHHLSPWCKCLEVTEMPFVLRDHQRRAQFTVAQASVWEVE